ncbi:Hypothetical predicted protein, partial [Pelobates cultripes]
LQSKIPASSISRKTEPEVNTHFRVPFNRAFQQVKSRCLLTEPSGGRQGYNPK